MKDKNVPHVFQLSARRIVQLKNMQQRENASFCFDVLVIAEGARDTSYGCAILQQKVGTLSKMEHVK